MDAIESTPMEVEELTLSNYATSEKGKMGTIKIIDDIFHLRADDKKSEAKLQPIVKWPGGKEKELKYIIPNMPSYKRFFEPFVGGGSVFMAIDAEEYFINDLSTELIELYKNILTSNKTFFYFSELMDSSWKNAETFFNSNLNLVDIYISYRNNVISKNELKSLIHEFCAEKKTDILNILGDILKQYPCVLLNEMEKNLCRKMTRTKELEIEKHLLSDEDLNANVLTAIKSAVYMNYRELYNNEYISSSNPVLHCALFFFIRNYAYSGMFRYSNNGYFNVPYGGMAYNNKFLFKKLNYFSSQELLRHFKNTSIYNLDFEDFLKSTNPGKDDFIFLDPPYDSEFSTYAQNDFNKNDQKRLAYYLLNECKAKWMMIIKNTDFIFDLYNHEGIDIKTFDKEYLVSFMNRNDRKVTHLLITNYLCKTIA